MLTKTRKPSAPDSFRPAFERILSRGTYAEFSESLAASGCPRCALSKSRTRIVVDRGNPRAKILVIGEAPGETEDREGRAFVGRAGRSFDETMASVGLDTDRDFLICNVVKCRPPGNRRPAAEEAEACRPYLLKQISFIAPRAVVVLGATALKSLAPSKSKFCMKDEAGCFFRTEELPGIPCMVLYHPAALFYNRSLGPAMLEHARRLKAFIDGGCRPPEAVRG